MKGSEHKMKHTREEILIALHVIQDTCKEHGGCSPCPLSRNGTCVMNNDYPEEWNINDNCEMVWKGLF